MSAQSSAKRRPLSAALVEPKPSTWSGFLDGLIDSNWRPGEYDAELRAFIPNPDNDTTRITNRCTRSGCQTSRSGSERKNDQLCRSCRTEWTSIDGLSLVDFKARRKPAALKLASKPCLVHQCPSTRRGAGLCNGHWQRYLAARPSPSYTAQEWIDETHPEPFTEALCVVPGCDTTAPTQAPLCRSHLEMYERWSESQERPSIDLWLERKAEPIINGFKSSTLVATLFGLMPGTTGSEFLYAVQQRDGEGKTALDAVQIRILYQKIRSEGIESLVGFEALGMREERATIHLYRDLQQRINQAHDKWTGRPDSTYVVHHRDLAWNGDYKPGPNATSDFTDFTQAWLATTIVHWIRHGGPHSEPRVRYARLVWKIADTHIATMGKRPDQLNAADMDTIVAAVRQKYPNKGAQSAALLTLWRIIEHGRQAAPNQIARVWRKVPAGFARSDSRHRVVKGASAKPDPHPDEPFRYVPAPIIDHVMNHLHLIDRHSEYKTVEARVMLYVHERTGRRTGETLRLPDACLEYDDQGNPYLIWYDIKKKRLGRRLPIHQETHDAIREWQRVKQGYGIRSSKWLFPSSLNGAADRHYHSDYLNLRLTELVSTLTSQAPLTGPVEGVEGNLIHFDLNTLDAYSFRHAYAQAHADAVDENGNSTTPPDVLQSLMGHSRPETTQAYYSIAQKRRKRAVLGVPARRIAATGDVVEVNRERDGFTRIAVTHGHCEEPQNVLAGGLGCLLNYACESCPHFRVDPLERAWVVGKKHDLRVQLERATIIQSPRHMLDFLAARIEACQRVIDGIDAYLLSLEADERASYDTALAKIADIQQHATQARYINIRAWLAPQQEAIEAGDAP